MKRSLLALPVLVVLLAACAPAPAGGTSLGEVRISGFAFQPSDLTVKAGTTVTWTNTDAAPHTVTADDGSFTSGTLTTGQTFTHTFSQAGRVAYHCAIHPDMKASVTVTAP